MSSAQTDTLPEPDRLEGAPHPRATAHLFGQKAAEESFLAAYNHGRLHHAWLISGPRGIGKATLAWRLARFLLALPPEEGGLFAPPPPETLDLAPDHPVRRRTLALSEPRLFLLRRGPNDKGNALSQVITVDEVRKLRAFFALSAADGGRRVAIVDAVDEMNPAAANALLKLLEEPPEGATFLLVAHQPHRLLPTIRSRCRELRLAPLAGPDLARALAQALDPAGGEAAEDPAGLGELAAGSVGEAFRLAATGGLELYAGLVRLLASVPRLDRPGAIALADGTAGKAGGDRFDQTVTLIDLFLSRLARAGTTGQSPPEAAPGEAALIARLAPDPRAALAWAELAQSLTLRARRARAVNLDPAALLMDILLRIDEMAGAVLRPPPAPTRLPE